jgi:hypothetical protein
MKAKRNVEMLSVDDNGNIKPATFDVVINSDDPVEPKDFLGPIDFEVASVKFRIAHSFATKFTFGSSGIQEVTAIMENPYTRTEERCVGKFEVKEYELQVSANPGRVPLGEDVNVQAHLINAQGQVTYFAKSSDGSTIRVDPQTGNGMVNFHSEGEKWITIYATDTLQDGSRRSYHVSTKQSVQVESGNSLACIAAVGETKAAADPQMGDSLEASVSPIGDKAGEVDIVSFNPGLGAYDVKIDQNIVRWRYARPGHYQVTGICRDRATGKVGRIFGPQKRIFASEPLSARVRANMSKAFTDEAIVISARSNGGMGKAHIAGIVAPENTGLRIIKSDSPNKWIIKFSTANPRKPYELMVELRDENGVVGACLPPHCTQAPVSIRVQDPSAEKTPNS